MVQTEPKPLKSAMLGIGFSWENGLFVHHCNPFTVDFVPSPVSIANDILEDFAQINTAFGPVRVLHSTDAVCDRLNKYIVWRDEDALSVALAVARTCGVDLTRIAAFIDRHAVGIDKGMYTAGYQRFIRALVPSARIPSPFGFTTAIRVRFAKLPSEESVLAVKSRMRHVLEQSLPTKSRIDTADVGDVTLVDENIALFALRLRTVQDLPFVERLRIAIDAIESIQESLDDFPELLEVIDDAAPPIASVE